MTQFITSIYGAFLQRISPPSYIKDEEKSNIVLFLNSWRDKYVCIGGNWFDDMLPNAN